MKDIYSLISFNFDKDLKNKSITIQWLNNYLHERSIVGGLRTKEIQINNYLEDLLHTKKEQD
tara:strand:- start:263 stop:448 length:186 start_codon:yes stop_codon:yes gene_type:complete